jgi:hypothetical protein
MNWFLQSGRPRRLVWASWTAFQFGCNGTESVKNNKEPAGTLLQDGNIFLEKKAKSKLRIMNMDKIV